MYLRPAKMQQACEALASRPFTVLAGGTDHFPARVLRHPAEDILDITGIADLRGIRKSAAGWRIGAGTTWREIAGAALPPLFDALKQAAREVGGPQVQNAGTVGGNLCNASPAADGVPPLLALDAGLELRSAAGRRTVPLSEFIRAPRKTGLAPGELLAAVHVPPAEGAARSVFLKLGARRHLVISIAMAALVLETREGAVLRARAAIGACSPVARRLPALEAALAGRPLDRSLADCVRPEHLAELAPIDDVRASAGYRKEAALVLLRRALEALGGSE